jgi:hypothetical protein
MRQPLLYLSLSLLYLSLYFKRHREDYYAHLQRVRTNGDWESRLRFFLEGVIEVAESTTHTTRRLVAMIESDRWTIHSFGRGAATAHRIHDLAARFIVLGASSAAEQLKLTSPRLRRDRPPRAGRHPARGLRPAAQQALRL